MKFSILGKYKVSLFLLMILSMGDIGVGKAQIPRKLDNGDILLEDFQRDTPGKLPMGWYDRDGKAQLLKHDAEEQAKYKYKILQHNENKFLRYEGTKAEHINYPLINRQKKNIYNIDILKTPVLSWDWRVYKLPKGANEDDNDLNDAAASIYVVFDFGHVLFKKVPKTIRYTWSSTLPKGQEMSKFFGNQKIIVLKSGAKDVGQWIHMQRNIVKDYKRLFGEDPPKTPIAILLLSDGDSTDSPAKADYDNIMLMPNLQ